MKDHLIIFLKNPIFKKLQDSKKLDNWARFLELLEYTSSIASSIKAQRNLYYDQFIENDGVFHDQIFSKKIHTSSNPRQQLKDAVKESFGNGQKKLCLWGQII